MLCPKCKSEQVFVVDTRNIGDTTWRRRKCESCGNRWNTKEIDQELYEAFMTVRDHILSRGK